MTATVFVHAIVKSFNSAITSDNHINEDMLLQLIQWHAEMNAHLYVSCFESKQRLLWQMEKYILDKSYKSLFGDIVVFITTAALNVIVVVIEMKNDKLTKTEIKSRENDCNLKRLYVFKAGEHYDALVTDTKLISGNDEINVTLAGDDKNNVKCLQNPQGFSHFSSPRTVDTNTVDSRKGNMENDKFPKLISKKSYIWTFEYQWIEK